MKVYIACLAAYNSGTLHGEWIEPSSDVEELSEQIKAILKKSPAPDAEEWAFHDYDDFPNIEISNQKTFASGWSWLKNIQNTKNI